MTEIIVTLLGDVAGDGPLDDGLSVQGQGVV